LTIHTERGGRANKPEEFEDKRAGPTVGSAGVPIGKRGRSPRYTEKKTGLLDYAARMRKDYSIIMEACKGRLEPNGSELSECGRGGSWFRKKKEGTVRIPKKGTQTGGWRHPSDSKGGKALRLGAGRSF